MANQKYDNLTVLMASGPFNWAADPINAYLLQGATFDATDKTLTDVGAQQVDHVPVPGRQVDSTGSLLGWPASFNRVVKDQEFQVVIAKDDGSGNPLVLAYYDEDENGDPFILQNNGTLIVRPQLVEGGEPPILGVWVKI